MIFIQNPELGFIVAPKESEVHCKFNEIECYKYIILKSKNLFELDSLFNKIKNDLEALDILQLEDFLNKLINNNKDVLYIGNNNYFIDQNENYENKNLYYCVFSLFKVDEEILEIDNIKEIKKIKVSEYNYKLIKTHKQNCTLTGKVNTNNKLTEFFWNIDNIELFQEVYYEISLWKNNKLIKIYNDKNNTFVFAEHAINENDGSFELIVVAKDINGSVSNPSNFLFNLKTDIVDDFKITMENEYEEEINITHMNSPKFKIQPYEQNFDYKIYLNNQTFSLYESINDNKEYFKIDESKNCLYFYCPLILEDGKYLLNIEKIDDVGNKTGNYINPMGKYGRTFFNFVISNITPETPELINFFWISNTKCLLNFKSDDKTKTFKIYQNNFLIKETIESFAEITPIIESYKDLIIKIKSLNYMGQESEQALEVNIKKYIDFIDEINIIKDDFIFKDGEYFINNPKPVFKWNIQNEKNVKYYSISLDGSNWINIKDNSFIFSNYLKDGKYTFRIKTVNLDNVSGQINTFNFKLQTRNSITPLFSKETLTLKPNKIDKIKLNWLKVNNIKNYEFCFNEPLLINEEKIYKTDYEEVSLIDYKDDISTGINNIKIRSIDYFGNSSDWNCINFIVLNDENILEEEVLSINFNLQDKPNNTKFTFNFPENLEYPYKKLFLISPDDVDIEIIDEVTGTEWTNNYNFDIDGVWKLEVQYFKKINDKIVFNNDIIFLEHIYNSYYFELSYLVIEKETVKWNNEINNNYNYYEYSICLKDFDYVNFQKTYSNEIDLKNKLFSGDYKLMLRTYSLNNILCEEKEIFFSINKQNNFIEEEQIINNKFKIKIKKFLKEKIFYITEIKNLNNQNIDCILLFKKVQEQYYNIYQNQFLILNTNYNFILNEVEINE